jgi:hypothetical protein
MHLNGAADLPQSAARLERTATGWRLERVQVIRRPLAETYAFFERPENLAAITPPWLRFRILSPSPVPMHAGARITYRLSLFGVPLRWRTRITRHEPGRAFVDEQESGPFALWRHLHEFRAHPEGTWMLDRVDYRPPLGPLGGLAQRLFVGRMVERIFDFRRARIADLVEAGGRR